jgi:hypothetical protein
MRTWDNLSLKPIARGSLTRIYIYIYINIDGLALACAGELGELIDSKKGHLVSEHEVFNRHSRKFELAYMNDMEVILYLCVLYYCFLWI